MSKHSMRCRVCNKFVTWRDVLDDGTCESCHKNMEAYAEARAKRLRQALMVLAFLWIMMFVLGIWLYSKASAETSFREEFYVTGVNLETNERVVGWLDGELGGNEVQGTVWDRLGNYVVVGITSGNGQYELRSLCCRYRVVVVDEVTNNKIENRRTWQESWK